MTPGVVFLLMRRTHFFRSAASFRAWLARHHQKSRELIVGFYTVKSGITSITYPEALDEALCVGWIDGIRRRLSPESYSIRFTPRNEGTHWSRVNIDRVG